MHQPLLVKSALAGRSTLRLWKQENAEPAASVSDTWTSSRKRQCLAGFHCSVQELGKLTPITATATCMCVSGTAVWDGAYVLALFLVTVLQHLYNRMCLRCSSMGWDLHPSTLWWQFQ